MHTLLGTIREKENKKWNQSHDTRFLWFDNVPSSIELQRILFQMITESSAAAVQANNIIYIVNPNQRVGLNQEPKAG